MYTGGEMSDDTFEQLHQSYQSDQGPQTNSVQSTNAAIKERDIMNCMKILQQQLRQEDIQSIDIKENENTIHFLNQYDTFNSNQKQQQQQYLNNVSTQNQYEDSNFQSSGKFPNSKDNRKQSLNLDRLEKQSQNFHPNKQKQNLVLNEQDQSETNYSIENNVQQNNQIPSLDQLEDEEDIMKRIHEMVEHYKSMSQMENYGSGDEEEGDIEDDYLNDENTQDSKKIREQIREEIFQNFLQRNQQFNQQKQVSLQMKRMNKNLEESSYQKKDFMSKKSKQICQELPHQFNKSIGDRAQQIIQKKQREKLIHEATLRYLETQDCTFKPLLNPNSMNLFKDKYRSADEFYEDMQQWQRQKELNKTNIQLQCNLEKEEQERLEREKEQVGLQLDPNSMRICERKNMNGDFLIRLEQDLDQRSLKKKQLELSQQPSFQPLIYENMRSPAIINQMKNEKTNYRLQKVKEEQQTWNQFSSPISIKSKKANPSQPTSDFKKKNVNISINNGSNKSFLEQDQTTPLSDQKNKVFSSVVQNSAKQPNKLNNTSYSNNNLNVKKVNSSQKYQQNEIQNPNNDFSSINDSKKNQFNSNNKYNSTSTKFTSIKSNQKEAFSNKKPLEQQNGNQQFSQSPFQSNTTINQYESGLSNSKNQVQCTEFQINNNQIEQLGKEQFSSFIQQNLNKLKSTLNKMP